MKKQRNFKKIVIAFILLILLTNTVFNSRKIIRTQPKSEIIAPTLPTTSEWTYNGIPICIASNTQTEAKICNDGDGGAIIVWVDRRLGDFEYDIYAQRVNSTGDVHWTINGIVVCIDVMIDDPLTYENPLQICSDGAGGVIITFVHGLGTSRNIFAARVDENGVVVWGSGSGAYVCSAGGYQGYHQICSDGAGGAIITWYDSGSGNGDIYAQLVDSSGTMIWTANGVAICTTSDFQGRPQLCSDGAGGAIIIWEDRRVADGDIYAQRINSTGVVQWTTDGVPICTVSDYQSFMNLNPQICSDGAGGAIITWEDRRVDSESNIYAQKVNANGVIQWSFNGRALCSGLYTFSTQICSDGSGGAFIVWILNYLGYAIYQVYVERIDTNGIVQVGSNGIYLDGGEEPQICSDGAGGAIITWQRGNDIKAQHINSSVDELWTVGGEPICTANNVQRRPQICSNGEGGAIITWEDRRTEIDIYAAQIQSAYPTSNHPGDVTTAIGRSESIEWTLSDDIKGGQYRVIVNNTNGDIYEWVGWTPWTIDVPLSIAINRSTLGVFNYTIEFYDNHTQYGESDSVIVIVEENDAPTSNHPNDINIVEFRYETISWTLYDDFGGGQYKVMRNLDLWKNWTSWTINSSLDVAINTTILGNHNYTIFFHDDQNLYGTQDTVIVNIEDDQNPTSDHPVDILTTQGAFEYVRWVLTDDYGGGSYRAIANNSLGNFYVYKAWESWTVGQTVSIPINRTALGIFNYTIEYYDDRNQYGVLDTVLVTVVQNYPPSCNHPNDITTSTEDTETIQWILNDDFGGGMYRIIITPQNGGSSTWIDWTSWDSNVPLNVPIDRSRTGVFNYTIEYRDIYSVYGIADIVKVTIPGGEEEGFPLPILIAIIGGIGAIAVIIPIIYLKRRK